MLDKYISICLLIYQSIYIPIYLPTFLCPHIYNNLLIIDVLDMSSGGTMLMGPAIGFFAVICKYLKVFFSLVMC